MQAFTWVDVGRVAAHRLLIHLDLARLLAALEASSATTSVTLEILADL